MKLQDQRVLVTGSTAGIGRETAMLFARRGATVIITGRDAAPELIDIADTATEMRMVKHAYDRGINARKGIEY